MKRRHFFLKMPMILLMLLALALLPAGAGADTDACGSSPDGQHHWESYNYADCTSGGSSYRQCSYCYEIRDEVWVDALGHNYQMTASQPATCTAPGSITYTCTRCGDVYTATDEATGHVWDNGQVTTAATCTQEGVRTFTCTRCGETRTESIAKTNHSPVSIPAAAATCNAGGKTEGSKCSVCGTILTAPQDTDALGHAWDNGQVTTAATCTQDGVRTFTCTRCGETRTESIAKTNHSPVSIPAVAATCTAGGKTEGSQCSVCGTVLTAQQDTAALGHSWDGGAVTTAPTCTQDGVKTFTCTRCGATYTETIAKTGHTPVSIPAVAATCTAGGKTEGSQCSVCGTVLTAQQDTAALGHAWDGGVVTTAATCTQDGVRTSTCTRCGATYTETIAKINHAPVAIPAVAATCTAGGKTEGSQCSACGTILTAQQDTAALGHSWDGGAVTTAPTCTQEGVKTFTCTRCGATYTETIAKTNHTPVSIPAVAATCTAGGKTEGSQCSACGTILTAQQDTAALGHSWDGGAVTTAATCTQDGVKTFTCTRCGATYTEAIAKVAHTPVSIPAVAATCTAGGKTEGSQCSACGTILTAQQDTAALGHSWDGGVVTTAPTCTQDGVKTFTCTRCGATYTETIAKTGHTPVSIPAVAATCTAGGKTEGSKCSVCGTILTAQQDTAALGHNWDSGAVTREAGYLEPGVKTYTCTRCGETKTEEIQVNMPMSGGSIMDYFRNIPPEAASSDPLRIVTEPVGGSIDYEGGSMILSVEAAGGVPPYTYQWRKANNGKWFSFWSDVEGGTDSTLEVTRGNYKYYCKVFDSKGDYVDSEKVLVSWNLYIAEQPQNVNLYGKDSVTLSCTAAGGEPHENGTYIYVWYNSADEQISFSDHGTVEVSELGEYYCMVQDNGAGLITSKPVTVYSQKPLKISDVSGTQELDKGEKATISCAISGGEAPYHITWLEDDEVVSVTEGGKDTYTLPVTGNGENEVIYTIKVVDSHGDEESAKVSVLPKEHNLKITSLNSYAIIDKLGDEVEFVAVVEGGKPPYSYRWRKMRFDPDYERANSHMITESTDFIENESSFKVNEPFTAWELTVKDNEGTRVTSQTLLVAYDGEFDIIWQPESLTYNTYARDEMYNCTMFCKAVGPMGHELLYQWEKKENRGWVRFCTGSTMTYSERKTETHFYYIQDGIFRCRVTDMTTGEELISREAKITLPKIHVTASSKGTSVFLTIEGGKGPYTITCSGRENKIFENWVIGGDYSLSPRQVKTIAQGSRWLEVEITGLPRREKQWADVIPCWTYNFTITDILGNTAKVSIQMK